MTFGATLSCKAWPVRSTRGALHARVLWIARVAAVLMLLANGLTCPATALSQLAVRLARVGLVLLLRDMCTSAMRPFHRTLPRASHSNHRGQ